MTLLQDQLTYSGHLKVVTCTCQIRFAIPEGMWKEIEASDNRWIYCPNGHRIHWTINADQREAARLRDAETRNTALRDQLEASVRDAEAIRAALLRDRHRFANGVCPCCNRSFDNVRRHMTTKHPDYDVTRISHRRAVQFACTCERKFDTLHGLHIHQSRSRHGEWFKPGAPAWRAHLTKV